MYVPFFYYLFCDNWKIKDFGFVLNYQVATILVVIIVFIMFRVEHISLINWQSSMIETFARTGEELFFRGFLYTLLLKIFRSKKKPWLWAVIISSLAFALMHTQTFLPEYNSSMLDIFILAMIMALLRKWTGSILFAISIHVLLKAGILGVIFGLIGYLLFVLVSYLKGELAIKQ